MDFMDLGTRQETLNIRGEPILMQLCVVPAYALTVHKTQALSIRHLVLGCLEGVFALGQVYVLISRVTDPQNFSLLGIPSVEGQKLCTTVTVTRVMPSFQHVLTMATFEHQLAERLARGCRGSID